MEVADNKNSEDDEDGVDNTVTRVALQPFNIEANEDNEERTLE